MRGDFSHLTFRSGKHYAGVLHQQGRVWLDSDWNDDVAERLDLLEQETRDVIGLCGVPKDPGTAFKIEPIAGDLTDFTIGGGPGAAGRAYVDGILCRLDASTTYKQQPDYFDPDPIAVPAEGNAWGLVYLEVWRRLITYLEDPEIRETALEGPDTATRLKTVAQVKVLLIPEREKGLQPVTCKTAGTFLPQPGDGTLTTLPPDDAQPDDPCRLPDPALYTGRENHLYRVEIHESGGVRDPGQAIGRGAREFIRFNRGIARFKWSRDNASFAVGVTAVSDDRLTLTVEALGRDQITALREGDLVEIADDASELGPARGHLTQLTAAPDPDLFTVKLADPLPVSFNVPELKARHLLLRRWDGQGWASSAFDETKTPDMDLGDGVRIHFGGNDLRAGDWWNFAARAVDGTIEQLTDAPPLGVVRHYCPLAVVGWGIRGRFDINRAIALAIAAGFTEDHQALFRQHLIARATPEMAPADILADASAAGIDRARVAKLRAGLAAEASNREMRIVEDCRNLFPPLTDLPAGGEGHPPYQVLKSIGGDGQEGAPGARLPCPLAAAVEDERGRPVAGVQLTFNALGGGIVTDPITGLSQAMIPVVTDQNGIAEAIWTLGFRRGCQRVDADFAQPPAQGAHLPVHFKSEARETAPQRENPRIERISWDNDLPLPRSLFNRGLRVGFTEPMADDSANLANFVVVVELPDHDFNAQRGFPGHRPFIMLGEIASTREGMVWEFVPRPELDQATLKRWIDEERQVFDEANLPLERPNVRCRVTLKGNVILDANGKRPLDGDAFGVFRDPPVPDPNTGRPTTDLSFPTGDAVRGGDFESWFYLVEDEFKLIPKVTPERVAGPIAAPDHEVDVFPK